MAVTTGNVVVPRTALAVGNGAFARAKRPLFGRVFGTVGATFNVLYEDSSLVTGYVTADFDQVFLKAQAPEAATAALLSRIVQGLTNNVGSRARGPVSLALTVAGADDVPVGQLVGFETALGYLVSATAGVEAVPNA